MTVLAEPIITADIAEHYETGNAIAVRAFLAAHPHLIAFLAEAPAHIARFFPEAHLQLHYHSDPEDGHELLALSIRSPQDVPQALATMDALLDAWYLDLPPATQRDALLVLG